MSNIPLTKDGGLDPRLTYCRRCGCEANEIIIGDNRLLKNEQANQTVLAPRNRIRQIAKDMGWAAGSYSVEKVPDGPLPATEFCDSCKKETAEFEEVVKAGGVYWRCTECTLSGVIRKSDFATHIRELSKVAAPEPTGVDFATCDEHVELGIAKKE